jgi:hypothetical protein
MTEQEIEIKIGRMMDNLDKKYMAGEFTTEEYDYEVQLLTQKAKNLYAEHLNIPTWMQ